MYVYIKQWNKSIINWKKKLKLILDIQSEQEEKSKSSDIVSPGSSSSATNAFCLFT